MCSRFRAREPACPRKDSAYQLPMREASASRAAFLFSFESRLSFHGNLIQEPFAGCLEDRNAVKNVNATLFLLLSTLIPRATPGLTKLLERRICDSRTGSSWMQRLSSRCQNFCWTRHDKVFDIFDKAATFRRLDDWNSNLNFDASFWNWGTERDDIWERRVPRAFVRHLLRWHRWVVISTSG